MISYTYIILYHQYIPIDTPYVFRMFCGWIFTDIQGTRCSPAAHGSTRCLRSAQFKDSGNAEGKKMQEERKKCLIERKKDKDS